jgi:hypothetical protein
MDTKVYLAGGVDGVDHILFLISGFPESPMIGFLFRVAVYPFGPASPQHRSLLNGLPLQYLGRP